MKFWIYIVTSIITMLVFFIVFSLGFAFQEIGSYTGSIPVSDQQVQDFLDSHPAWAIPDRDTDGISINLLRDVAHRFKFSKENNLSSWYGNCEGQSVMCCAVVNNAFQRRGITDSYAEPVLCIVKWYGLNVNHIICSLVPANNRHFFINHCVVKLHRSDGSVIYYDPTRSAICTMRRN